MFNWGEETRLKHWSEVIRTSRSAIHPSPAPGSDSFSCLFAPWLLFRFSFQRRKIILNVTSDRDRAFQTDSPIGALMVSYFYVMTPMSINYL